MGGYTNDIAAFFVVVGAGGFAALRFSRRSIRNLDTVDDAYVLPVTEQTPAAEAAVRQQAQPEVAELQALAQKIEAGEPVTPAEHARIAQLVGELGTLEQRPDPGTLEQRSS